MICLSRIVNCSFIITMFILSACGQSLKTNEQIVINNLKMILLQTLK
jgi:hypothetical protein